MGFRTKFRSAVAGRTQADIEHSYLSAAVSVTDLERRQREIDQGLLRPRRFGF